MLIFREGRWGLSRNYTLWAWRFESQNSWHWYLWDFVCEGNINGVLTKCMSLLHALWVLREHGLSRNALRSVLETIIGSPTLERHGGVWLCSRQGMNKNVPWLPHSDGCILSEADADMDYIMSTSEHNLFKSIMAYDHDVLHPLFPPIVKRHYHLRQRSHDLVKIW